MLPARSSLTCSTFGVGGRRRRQPALLFLWVHACTELVPFPRLVSRARPHGRRTEVLPTRLPISGACALAVVLAR
eukprot:scaffold12632_cov90-Isochrysis_galbana.AAC.2